MVLFPHPNGLSWWPGNKKNSLRDISTSGITPVHYRRSGDIPYITAKRYQAASCGWIGWGVCRDGCWQLSLEEQRASNTCALNADKIDIFPLICLHKCNTYLPRVPHWRHGTTGSRLPLAWLVCFQNPGLSGLLEEIFSQGLGGGFPPTHFMPGVAADSLEVAGNSFWFSIRPFGQFKRGVGKTMFLPSFCLFWDLLAGLRLETHHRTVKGQFRPCPSGNGPHPPTPSITINWLRNNLPNGRLLTSAWPAECCIPLFKLLLESLVSMPWQASDQMFERNQNGKPNSRTLSLASWVGLPFIWANFMHFCFSPPGWVQFWFKEPGTKRPFQTSPGQRIPGLWVWSSFPSQCKPVVCLRQWKLIHCHPVVYERFQTRISAHGKQWCCRYFLFEKERNERWPTT